MQSSVQMPGVVERGVVVVDVVVVVLVVLVAASVAAAAAAAAAAAFACARIFSTEIGVVDGVGQPVNSVVALVGHPF